ncbi:MAG: oligosaccharide flippase family protein [Cyanobacteria bacterium P01_A01_bin.40]
MSSSSLKKQAVRGTAWTVAGYGTSQILRFGSNLVLTRLLVPEYFGLMAIINVLLIGLSLFSDIGIGSSIIQNKRGDDPTFLNTAWTIQIFRGFALWLCSCICALPFARLYGETQLIWIIPVSGLTAIISGFNSTGLFTANRHMKLSVLTLIELGSQTVTILVMVTWALFFPSIWALVAGGLTGALMKMIASHLWLADIPNRLTWNQESFKSIIHFGRWIFVSTVLGFFIGHADKLILGKFLSLSDLGVYSIASMMSKLMEKIYDKISHQVLFPIYSKLNHLSPQQLRQKVKKIRTSLMMFLLPPLWCLVIFGSDIINFLYDSRYQDAGWMLQVLSAGVLFLISYSIGPFHLAYGNSFLFMKLVATRSFIFLAAMFLGGFFAGKVGLICGIAISNLIFYPIEAFVYRRFSLWIPQLDALGILGSGTVIATGLWFKHVFI